MYDLYVFLMSTQCLSSSTACSRPTQEWLFLLEDLSLVKILLNESSRETDEEFSLTSSNDGGAVGGEPEATSPTGPSLGSGSSLGLGWTSFRQTGQVEQVVSHVSIQSTWKTCLQFGNSLAVSCSSNTLRHTAHSVAAATSPPLAPTVKVGREAMTVESRPRFGGWKGWRKTTGRPWKVLASLRRWRMNLA